MKKQTRRAAIGLAAAAIGLSTLAASGPAAAQGRVLAVNDIEETTVKGQSFELFKKLVSQKSGGRLKLEVSHGEALYNQKSLVQAMQLGAVNITAPGIGLYTGTFPKLLVLGLPYLLPSPDAIREAVADPKIGGVLFDDMRKKGIEPLGIWLNGPRDVGWTGDTPILLPSDMKGKKIRVAPGDVYVATFKQLGANVTTMSWGEVPTALRTGVIDAVEPTPNAWVGSHMYEIAKQITKTAHIWDFYIVTANKAWWSGLPEADRKIWTEAVEEASKWNWQGVEAENAKAIETMVKSGAQVHELSPQNRAAWTDAMRPLWNELGDKQVGADTMKLLIAIGDKYRGQK